MRTHYGGYATHKEYQNARRRLAVMVYFPSGAQKDELRAKALASGYQHFSHWIVQQVMNASSGAVYQPEYVESLKQDTERSFFSQCVVRTATFALLLTAKGASLSVVYLVFGFSCWLAFRDIMVLFLRGEAHLFRCQGGTERIPPWNLAATR